MWFKINRISYLSGQKSNSLKLWDKGEIDKIIDLVLKCKDEPHTFIAFKGDE